MTEDELYLGITEALTLAGWRWMHIIRSDGVMAGTGAYGFPDLVAVHPSRSHVIAWELKSDHGQPTLDQWAWIGPLAVIATIIGDHRFDSRIVRPSQYAAALDYIVGKTERFVA